MREHDLAPLFGRLHDAKPYLEGCHTPGAIVVERFAVHDPVVEFLELRAPLGKACRPGQVDIVQTVVVVDIQTVRRMADVAAVAGCDHDAEVARRPRLRTLASED